MSTDNTYHGAQETATSNQFSDNPQGHQSLKRRSPSEEDSAEKRQKVERVEGVEGVEKVEKFEPDAFEAMLAAATASATAAVKREEPPAIAIPIAGPWDSKFAYDPSVLMRTMSLPMLESLSIQILSTMAQGPYHETIQIVTDPTSDYGQSYTTLKALFDQTKNIYIQDGEYFLSADDLSIGDEHRLTIRNTNLATWVVSVFGGQDVGFYELDESFIDTFTPDDEALSMEAGLLYVNFKTQTYISASQQEVQDRSKEEVLEELFPQSLKDNVLGRHPTIPLVESEDAFVNACMKRKEYLMSFPAEDDAFTRLSAEFSWENFLEELSIYLNRVYGPMLKPYMKKHALKPPSPPAQGNLRKTFKPETNHLIAQADRFAQEALQGMFGPNHQQNGGFSQNHHTATPNGSHFGTNGVAHHTQSAPTQTLYEQARQAAAAKSNPGNPQRLGSASQRRPWSTEEENALMAGLDEVRGPHWSQILALYGKNGTNSSILEERSQVQLKDKARNLKLFFLKSSIEVPYYLQCVTGELKTRAPGQAARKEAEERQKSVENAAAMRQPFEDLQVQNSFQPINHQPIMSEDEQLRQTLIAANNATDGVDGANNGGGHHNPGAEYFKVD